MARWKPWRQLPLAWQLVAVIVASVVIVNVVAFNTLLSERTGALSQMMFRDLASRTEPLLRQFADTGTVATPSDPDIRLLPSDQPLQKGRRGEEIERLLKQTLPQIDVRVSVQVRAIDQNGRPTLPRPSIQLKATRLDGQTLLLAVAGPPMPVFPVFIAVTTGLYSLLVCVGGIWVVARITRPLSDLALGAEALGRERLEGPVEERGPPEVRAVAASFNTMATRLRALVGRQRATLWALGHDLRTPLTAMRLRIELMQDDTERATMLSAWEEIDRVADDALWLARAGSSQEPLEEADLHLLATRALASLRATLEPGQAARLDLPSGEAVSCMVRPAELVRAIRNLAANAIMHGQGTVKTSVGRDDTGRPTLMVRDQGDGFPAPILTGEIVPFQRGDPSRHTPGTGLGLAIAKAVAEAHGGQLVLTNPKDGGACACLVLPA